MLTRTTTPASHHLLVAAHTVPRDDTALVSQIQRADDHRRSLLVVLPEIPPHYFQLPSLHHLEMEIKAAGLERLKHLCAALDIPEDRAWLQPGNCFHAACHLAKSIGADHIITDDKQEITFSQKPAQQLYQRFKAMLRR